MLEVIRGVIVETSHSGYQDFGNGNEDLVRRLCETLPQLLDTRSTLFDPLDAGSKILAPASRSWSTAIDKPRDW